MTWKLEVTGASTDRVVLGVGWGRVGGGMSQAKTTKEFPRNALFGL